MISKNVSNFYFVSITKVCTIKYEPEWLLFNPASRNSIKYEIPKGIWISLKHRSIMGDTDTVHKSLKSFHAFTLKWEFSSRVSATRVLSHFLIAFPHPSHIFRKDFIRL